MEAYLRRHEDMGSQADHFRGGCCCEWPNESNWHDRSAPVPGNSSGAYVLLNLKLCGVKLPLFVPKFLLLNTHLTP
jgi:hypothetical protein